MEETTTAKKKKDQSEIFASCSFSSLGLHPTLCTQLQDLSMRLPGRAKLLRIWLRLSITCRVSPLRLTALVELWVYEILQKLLHRFHWIVPGYIMGGENRSKEKARLRKGISILVATPGRLLDHLKHTSSFLGFGKEIEDILDLLGSRKIESVAKGKQVSNISHFQRQNLLLSATLNEKVNQLAKISLENPVLIGLDDKKIQKNLVPGNTGSIESDEDDDSESPRINSSNEDYKLPTQLVQRYVKVPCGSRLAVLLSILKHLFEREASRKIVVFFSTCDAVDFHYSLLNEFCWSPGSTEAESMEKFLKYNIFRLHGNMKQEDRRNTFQDFKAEKFALLLSTDIAARGLDFPKVKCIIQYDSPGEASEYVHRLLLKHLFRPRCILLLGSCIHSPSRRSEKNFYGEETSPWARCQKLCVEATAIFGWKIFPKSIKEEEEGSEAKRAVEKEKGRHVPISRRFSSLPHPNFINHQIKSLVQQGHNIEALQLYSRNPFPATKFTYPSLLKACASIPNLQYGQTIHSTIITKSFSLDPFVTSSLISFYVKCGSLKNAAQVFDTLPQSDLSRSDVTIWNALIDGYFRFGHVKEGLALFGQMQRSGVRPDGYSLCNLLGVCDVGLGCFGGKQIHGYVVRNGFDYDLFLEIALIDMYFRSGRAMDAWRLFEGMEDKSNVVTWNVLIRGFGEAGLWERSLELYLLAKNSDVRLVSASFTSTLSACCQGELVSFGEQVQCEVIKRGFEDDSYVCTALLTMYAKCKLVGEAEKVFRNVVDKRIETWNAMISAYVGNGYAYDAFEAYNHMKLCKVPPDLFTMSVLLSGSSMVGSYDFGRSIHAELVKRTIQNDSALQSALLTMYSRCKSNGEAYLVFSTIKDKDVVAWGSMVSAFCHNKQYKEAFDVFREMEAHGVKPDSDIMASVVSACTRLDDAKLGCSIHGFVIKSGLWSDVFVASSLIDMYSKLGFLEMAESVFSDMPLRNIVAWNSIMSCYCRNGLPEMSIDLFSRLVHHGLYPNSVSITTVLTAVSSAAALLKGKS
ncbi:hypothetical protein Tsubulata_005830, partial [Turnera subulata]